MKKIILLASFVISSAALSAQCVIQPFSLQKTISISDLIIEGTVLEKQSFWDAGHQNIYTSNTILVHKLFNGTLSEKRIELITEGGTVGMKMHRSDPSLQVKKGEMGIFLLRKCTIEVPDNIKSNENDDYQPSASLQSFLRYDLEENIAYGYFYSYQGIESLLFPKIESFTGKKYQVVSDNEREYFPIKSLSAPIIDSFSRDTITAGTGSKLTIYGSNFSFSRGSNGRVMFTDPDYGDGRFYDELLDANYVSWSNSKIEVIVPSKSGTGKVKVVNAANESGTSSSIITVLYAHQNVLYGRADLGLDTSYHQIDLINLNGKGGYSWQFNSTFRSNFNAVNAFLRSMETWRCNTLVNWDLGDDTSLDVTADDNVNIVRWTTFSDNRLGVCWSRFGGCFSAGPVVHWHAEELDIEFDKDRNWYFGEDKPQTSQYDFQSVASHELGHGHQMGHVINSQKMMHYSISIGERKSDLHTDDIACGEYIRDKSKAKNPCGPGPLVPIKAEDCNITRPKAALSANKTTVCPGDTVTFSEMSEGVVNNYIWDFGPGADLASSNGAGPYKVTYSQPGTVKATLIVTNDFGADTAVVEIVVQQPAPDMPEVFLFDTLICSGIISYTINTVERATSYQWTVPGGGGTIEGSNGDTTVSVRWTNSGIHTIEVVASNSCGVSAPRVADVRVLLTTAADFTYLATGRTVTFTNLSTGEGDFVWRFGDGDSSTQFNPVHEYQLAGVYAVEFHIKNACSEDSKTETIQVNWGVGIKESNASSVIDVFPNPATRTITCVIKGNMQDWNTIEITDLTGKVILSEPVNGRAEIAMDLEKVSEGMYLLILKGGESTFSGYKLIVSPE